MPKKMQVQSIVTRVDNSYINTVLEQFFLFLKLQGKLHFFVDDFFQRPQIECSANFIQNIDAKLTQKTIKKQLKEKISVLIKLYRIYYNSSQEYFSVKRLVSDSLLFCATTVMTTQEYYKLDEDWHRYSCKHIPLP